MIKIIMSLLLIINSGSVSALTLRSLTDASTVQLEKTKGSSVVVLFQKDCIACQKQVRDLSCFDKDTDVFLVGAFSEEKELRREYKIFNTKLPSYYGDKDFFKKFYVTERITPQIIILNNNKKLSHFMGRLPCAKIQEIVTKVSL